jgi:hypothetical protein
LSLVAVEKRSELDIGHLEGPGVTQIPRLARVLALQHEDLEYLHRRRRRWWREEEKGAERVEEIGRKDIGRTKQVRNHCNEQHHKKRKVVYLLAANTVVTW